MVLLVIGCQCCRSYIVITCVLACVVDELQHYFQFPLSYAKHFSMPMLSVSAAPGRRMFMLSKQLGVLMRRVHRGIRSVYNACQVRTAQQKYTFT